MPDEPTAHDVFPDEVADLIVGGAGEPDIYFGPVYRGNGGEKALAELDERLAEAEANAAASATTS
jgi:hypothetical protein